jgi:hypothetical protein
MLSQLQKPPSIVLSQSISIDELQNGILPLTDAAIELSGLIMGCRKLVRGRPQDQFLRPELQGEDDRIAEWENRLSRAAAQYRGGITNIKGPLALCYRWRLAIHTYLAKGDRAPLEELAFDGQDWREAWQGVSIDVGGADEEEAITRLCDRARSYRMAGYSWPKVAHHITVDIQELPNNALERLWWQTWLDAGKAAEYLRRAYRRREKSQKHT